MVPPPSATAVSAPAVTSNSPPASATPWSLYALVELVELVELKVDEENDENELPCPRRLSRLPESDSESCSPIMASSSMMAMSCTAGSSPTPKLVRNAPRPLPEDDAVVDDMVVEEDEDTVLLDEAPTADADDDAGMLPLNCESMAVILISFLSWPPRACTAALLLSTAFFQTLVLYCIASCFFRTLLVCEILARALRGSSVAGKFFHDPVP